MSKSPIQAVILTGLALSSISALCTNQYLCGSVQAGFDFEIDLEEAREPMGLGKWDHIQAVGRIPQLINVGMRSLDAQ